MPAFDKRMASDRKSCPPTYALSVVYQMYCKIRCTVKCTPWISGTFPVKDARGRTEGTVGAAQDQHSELAVSGHREVGFEMTAYLGLALPSHSVRLVEGAKNRSVRLPASCDACQKVISDYPFIAKHGTHAHHRKYHIPCALRIGLVSPIPKKV